MQVQLKQANPTPRLPQQRLTINRLLYCTEPPEADARLLSLASPHSV